MRHSPKMPDRGGTRNRHIERRALKRAHREHNSDNPKTAMSLKEFARALVEGTGPELGRHHSALVDRAAEWLGNKATKQVRTVHPKRLKSVKSDIKVKQKKKEG